MAAVAENSTAAMTHAAHPEQLADIRCQMHQEIAALAETSQGATLPFTCVPYKEWLQFELRAQNQQV